MKPARRGALVVARAILAWAFLLTVGAPFIVLVAAAGLLYAAVELVAALIRGPGDLP